MPQKKRLKSISPEDAAISNYLMQSNRDKNFVQRAYNNNYAPRLQTNTIPGYSNKPDNMYSTELMSYDPGSQRVYPEIVQRPGQKELEYLGGDRAWDYADSTGEYIKMPPSEKVMDMFSDYGYKHASGIPIYKKGGSINTNTMSTKKDRYPQVGPRDWMNKNGWYAKEGGVWEKDSKGKINTSTPKGISVGTSAYQDWEHKPVSKKKLTKQEQEIEELRRQQANTTPIGYQPNVQQYIRNKLANNYPILANTIGYPVVAAARMTDPTYSYTQGQSGYAAFPGAGQAIIDAESVLPVARGIYNTLPTPKVPKGYSGPMLTDLVPEELPLHPGTNFPVGYIKRNVKGNTPMPYMTEVPTLNKEQQILQSFGLDPYKKRISTSLNDLSGNPHSMYDDLSDNFASSLSGLEGPPSGYTNEQYLEELAADAKPSSYEVGLDKYKDRIFVSPNPYGKGEGFEVSRGPLKFGNYPRTGDQRAILETPDLDAEGYPNYADGQSKNIQDYYKTYPEQYTDFGPKTPYQKMFEGRQSIPESLVPTVRQQNKYGGLIDNTMTQKNKYPQVGPRNWMSKNGWYAERGGYKPSQGVLPQVMPGMYPGNMPIAMNQHATQPIYTDVPAYAHGGFYQKPGYFYNGHSMVKNKGTGTYSQDGYYFERGGYPHPLNTPFDTFEYGGEYNGYTGSVSKEAALRQLECMEEGGYPHLLDTPFDEFKKGGIHIKPENRGKFNALKKRTGKTTEELTHSKNPLTRKRAIFAQNAAKWKHEMGGPVNPFHPIYQYTNQYADGGPYDEDGGVSLPSANNAWGSSASNSEQQMSDAYGPVNQANQDAIKMDPNQNTRPGVAGDRANMNETPVDASGLHNPYDSNDIQSPEMQTSEQQGRRNGFVNWGSAILGAGTGILGAASILHDKYQNRKVQQQWIRDQNKSANLPTMINPMSKGTYSQDGNIPYSNFSQSPNIRTMQNGGYVKGSTHELSEAEINALIKKGYKLQRI